MLIKQNLKVRSNLIWKLHAAFDRKRYRKILSH